MNSIKELFTTIAMFFTTLQRLISAVDHAAEALEVTAAVALADVKVDNKTRLAEHRALVLEEAKAAAALAKAQAQANKK